LSIIALVFRPERKNLGFMGGIGWMAGFSDNFFAGRIAPCALVFIGQ
jgi:hypothetical protein